MKDAPHAREAAPIVMGVMGAPTDVPKNAKRNAAIERMGDVDLEQKSVYPNEQQDALIYE